MNPRILLAAAALPLFTACRAFDYEEAQDIALANTKTTVGAYVSAWDDFNTNQRRATTAELNWSESENSWSVDGSLSSDGPVWTGAMGFEGSLTVEEQMAEWALSIAYDQVQSDDILLDGDMSWRWSLELRDQGFRMEYEVQGEITATGEEVDGTGEMDYLATIDVDGNSVDIDADGKIGGTPIDFALTVNLPI